MTNHGNQNFRANHFIIITIIIIIIIINIIILIIILSFAYDVFVV
jgi:hypothetical protein